MNQPDQTSDPGGSVTSLYTAITLLLESEPHKVFTPREIAARLHKSPPTIRRALGLLSGYGKGAGPVERVAYGLYRYCPDKEKGLIGLFHEHGSIRVENLSFMLQRGVCPPSVTSHETSQNPDEDPSLPKPLPGYPKRLLTGQEIRREVFENGTEQISFVSNGRPFSHDLIIYLIDELNLNQEDWIRTRIEFNIDGRRFAIHPDSATLQSTAGIFLKMYNHGMQGRLEVADRRKVPLQDALVTLLQMDNAIHVKQLDRQIDQLIRDMKDTRMKANIAYSVASKNRDKLEALS